MAEKTLAFKISEEEHRKIKVKLANEGGTLKEYVLGLIRDDLNRENPPARVNMDCVKEKAEKISQLSSELLQTLNH